MGRWILSDVFARNTALIGSERDPVVDFCGAEISEFVEELST
jgi:hypothetical protein